MDSKKILILLILIISFSLLAFNFLKTQEAKAGLTDNVRGWAWGGYPTSTETGSGWFGFNCRNYYNGVLESHCIADGYASDYGVNIDPDGNFSGYVWSGGGVDAAGNEVPVLGWIRFDPPADTVTYPACGYPESPCHSVRVSTTTGEVSGWARAKVLFRFAL